MYLLEEIVSICACVHVCYLVSIREYVNMNMYIYTNGCMCKNCCISLVFVYFKIIFGELLIGLKVGLFHMGVRTVPHTAMQKQKEVFSLSNLLNKHICTSICI